MDSNDKELMRLAFQSCVQTPGTFNLLWTRFYLKNSKRPDFYGVAADFLEGWAETLRSAEADLT